MATLATLHTDPDYSTIVRKTKELLAPYRFVRETEGLRARRKVVLLEHVRQVRELRDICRNEIIEIESLESWA